MRSLLLFETDVTIDFTSPVGPVIDWLYENCDKLEYLRPSQARRYRYLLKEMGEFGASVWVRDSKNALSTSRTTAAIATLAADQMWHVLEQWVSSYQGSRAGLSMFALDTGRLLEMHLFGFRACRVDKRDFEVAAAVRGFRYGWSRGKNRAIPFGSGFKCRMSMEQLRGLLVVCCVPERTRVIACGRNHEPAELVAGPGERFLLQVERCYLSESVYDQNWIRIEGDGDNLTYDLMHEFDVPGDVSSKRDRYTRAGHIPGHWIEYVGRMSADEKLEFVPLPWATTERQSVLVQ